MSNEEVKFTGYIPHHLDTIEVINRHMMSFSGKMSDADRKVEIIIKEVKE